MVVMYMHLHCVAQIVEVKAMAVFALRYARHMFEEIETTLLTLRPVDHVFWII